MKKVGTFSPEGTIGNNGAGQPHTHSFAGTPQDISTLQPYITVYMWKRTNQALLPFFS